MSTRRNMPLKPDADEAARMVADRMVLPVERDERTPFAQQVDEWNRRMLQNIARGEGMTAVADMVDVMFSDENQP